VSWISRLNVYFELSRLSEADAKTLAAHVTTLSQATATLEDEVDQWEQSPVVTAFDLLVFQNVEMESIIERYSNNHDEESRVRFVGDANFDEAEEEDDVHAAESNNITESDDDGDDDAEDLEAEMMIAKALDAWEPSLGDDDGMEEFLLQCRVLAGKLRELPANAQQ
jgi:hypothetical protein